MLLNTTSLSFVQNKEQVISSKFKKAEKLFEQKEYTSSLLIVLEILKSEKSINIQELYEANLLAAKIFYATYDNINAVKYFKKSIYLFEENLISKNEYLTENSVLIISKEKQLNYLNSLLLLGNSFLKRKISSSNIKDLDSAVYYFKKVVSYNTNISELKKTKAVAYSNISGIYMQDGSYDKAEEYVLKAIEIHNNSDDKINEAAAFGNLSNIYLMREEYDKAKELYIKALKIISDIKTEKAAKTRRDLYENLAWNLYNMKDYKAYEYQEKAYIIKDSLQDLQVRTLIAEITEKHNFDLKRDRVLQEEENKRLKAQRPYWIIGGLLIAVIFFTLLYRVNLQSLKRKNLELKFEKSQLAQSQQIDRIRSESQTRILNATIDGKETERKQIAETLHDSVSALLSSANLHLQATKTAFNGKTPIEIDKTRDIITEASHKIRDLSHSLVSSVLLKFGIKFAIKDMAKKYSNSQIEITTDIGLVRRYEQDFEIKVHNITQEFLNNILKHSKATEAKIELEEKDKKLYLKVTDNGKGFDKTKAINKDGLGINQIEARIIVMKGKFVIDSEIGKGTSISVEIPVKEKEVMHHA